MTAFDDDQDHISFVFRRLPKIEKKGQLGEAIYLQVAKLSFVDVQVLTTALQRDITVLPSPYREEVRPYLEEQLIGRYNRILAMHSDGSFGKMTGDIRDREQFEGFCETAVAFGAEVFEYGKGSVGHHVQLGGLSYFLFHCFAMFVLDEPGHPVGMPVPGGFTVQLRDGTFRCPVRDREKGSELSLCCFCPARQDDHLYGNWCEARGYVL